MMRNETILVADSDATVVACIAEVLAAEGYTIHCHRSDLLTVEMIERVRPDLIVMEQWHGQPDVTPLLDQLRARATTNSIAVIVTTTSPQMLRDLAMPLQRRGCAMLLKPFDLDQLLESVAGALGHRWPRRPRVPEHYYA
jgi:CheY-like chemotaxis protein